MPRYTEAELAEIAAAISKQLSDITPHQHLFEWAANQYLLESGGHWKAAAQRFRPNRPKSELKKIAKAHRPIPPKIGQKLVQIEKTARRLLELLGNKDPSDAVDGPGDHTVLQVLAYAEPANEEAVIGETARIGRLVEIFDALHATGEFERRARLAAAEVKELRKLTGLESHQGDAAVNNWIAVMLVAYERITDRKPATSVAKPGQPNPHIAGGPLIRFLKAAGRPIGLDYDEDALRSPSARCSRPATAKIKPIWPCLDFRAAMLRRRYATSRCRN